MLKWEFLSLVLVEEFFQVNAHVLHHYEYTFSISISDSSFFPFQNSLLIFGGTFRNYFRQYHIQNFDRVLIVRDISQIPQDLDLSKCLDAVIFAVIVVLHVFDSDHLVSLDVLC